MPDTLKMKPLRRFLGNAAIDIRKDGNPAKPKTTISFSAASETPVERWYGTEVLEISDNAVKLGRAAAGAMPLLFNHNMDDPIGMITGARVEANRLLVDAALFATARAQEVLAMIEGGLSNVSIGYRNLVVEEDTKTETYTSTEWEPFEVSIVTVPADPSVGIGRAYSEEFEARVVRASQPADPARGKTMSNKDTATAAEIAEEAEQKRRDEAERLRREEQRAIESTQRTSAMDLEKQRVRAIENLCKANKLDDKYRQMWIGQGASIEQVSEDILKILEERGRLNPQPASRLGLGADETQRFSLTRAILACAGNNWANAPFELECSRAVADKLRQAPDPKKFYVPFEVLQREHDASVMAQMRHQLGLMRRDLTVATAGAGGYLASTDNVGFIEMLRNRSVAFRMGARRLSGLQGSVTVPRQSAAATAYWLSTEGTQITESQQTFVQMALSPKNVGAYTEVSRQLLLQSSPGAEGIVTDDLAQVVAIAADLGALEGSGASGQPTGISQTSGIGSVTGTSLAAAGVIEFMSDVAGSNVMPLRPGYVTTPAVAALLMARPELPSTGTTRLWTGNLWDGALFGVPAMTSAQLTAATMVFGDWQELVIAEWGVLEIEVNPYANFQAGIIGVRAMYSMDVGVRRPFAFSRATSIT